MSFLGLLDSICNIKQEVLGTSDGMGGYAASTWNTIYWNLPCCFEAMERTKEFIGFDKKAFMPDFVVYLEWHDGIREGMRLVKGSINYEIKLIENTKFLNKYMKLLVTELRRGE